MLLNNFDRIECHAICGKFEISMTTAQATKVYFLVNWSIFQCNISIDDDELKFSYFKRVLKKKFHWVDHWFSSVIWYEMMHS